MIASHLQKYFSTSLSQVDFCAMDIVQYDKRKREYEILFPPSSGKKSECECMKLMTDAQVLKKVKLNPKDPLYGTKVAALIPFLSHFSTHFGVSSVSIMHYMYDGGSMEICFPHYANDFDDWNRCLDKMRYAPIYELQLRLSQIQKGGHVYSTLIGNLALSMYMCLLFTIPREILQSWAFQASRGSKFHETLLTLHDVCDVKQWKCGYGPYRSHPYSDIFHSTFTVLSKIDVELPMQRCRCFSSNTIFDLFKWLTVSQKKAEPVEGEPVEGEPVKGEPVEGEPVEMVELATWLADTSVAKC